jgi:competence protein ComEA
MTEPSPPPIPSRQGNGKISEPKNQISLKLPYFSRSQLGVILLLGAVLIGLYAWRAHWWLAPSPAPSEILPLAFVEVAGQVSHPGVYSFPQPPNLGEVWQRAGAPGAPPQPENKIASGSRLEITADGGYRLVSMSGARLITLGLPIDLNRASAADLEALPGIGPGLAKKIVDYREAHGSFKKIEDLEEKVLGLGQKKVEKIKPFLIVSEISESR